MTLYGKHGKVRFPPIHPVAADRIRVYPERLRHQLANAEAPLCVPLRTVREASALRPTASIRW